MGIFLFCILVICIIGGIAYFTFRTVHSNIDVQAILLDFCRLKREQIAEDIQGIELEHHIGHISESQVNSRVNSLKILIDKIIKLEKSLPREFKDLNQELNELFLIYKLEKEEKND
tara:strand:+ start:279 stop:626 length:348 start_codon:yes stop_codon:yes gene_type:complete